MKIKPNFFLVGASKAGTTSLAEAIGTHPDAFMSVPKEPNFFDRFDDPEKVPSSKDWDNYLELFSGSESLSVVGEASVSYLDSELSAESIFSFSPEAKIIISLRNPLDRIKSLYEMYSRLGLKQSFEYATVTDPWLVQQCFYFRKVERFYSVFPKEQILWFDFDDLKSDWTRVVGRVHEFLGLDPVDMNKPVVRNVGGVPKNKFLNVFVNRNIVDFGKRVLPNKLHGYVDRKIKSLAFQPVLVEKNQRESLVKEFVDDVANLDELLGCNFSTTWLKV